VALDRISEGCEAPEKGYPFEVLTIQVPGGPNLSWRTPPLSGELMQYQSHHDDYAYSRSEVAI
jgi:hypothetical protein